MTFFRAFFLSFFFVVVSLPAFAGIGNYDKRQKADWTSDRFSKYVSIGGKYGAKCTGQYVAPNLILTAAHCYDGVKEKVGYEEWVYNPVIRDIAFKATLVARGDFHSVNDESQKQDWAILLVQDPKYFYTKGGFDIATLDKSKEYEPVINAGFGWVRILSNEEVDLLKKTLLDERGKMKKMSFDAAAAAVNKLREEKNFSFEDENLTLKYSECNVLVGAECTQVCSKDDAKCKNICENKSAINKRRWPEVLGTTCDSWSGNSGGASFSANTGELVSICSGGYDVVGDANDANYAVSAFALQEVVEQMRKKYPVNNSTDAKDTNKTEKTSVAKSAPAQKKAKENVQKLAGPNVGEIFDNLTQAPVELPNDNLGEDREQLGKGLEETIKNIKTEETKDNVHKLAGPNVGEIFDNLTQAPVELPNDNLGEDRGQLGKGLEEAIKSIKVEETNAGDEEPVEISVTEDPAPKVATIKKNVEDVLNDGDISVSDVLMVVDGMTTIQKLEEAYKKAKEKETSFENRMLGGVTMAATGIGGMQLAQGLAEKSADEAADKDMQAYLATFKCKVSDKSYTGGTMDIDVGGTNQLITLYQEYVDLAADLKARKEALGQKPGVESEVILNKAEMGLYDDVGKGIENGTYASLYRASRGNENDKKKLAEQKESSANRVKGGAIAAGGGALVGGVGNMLLNGGDDSGGFSLDSDTIQQGIQMVSKYKGN